MEITKIRIQAYRSLYDVELSPKPFGVVVGANNAGKSNLLDAIHFLGEVHRHGIDIAVSRKGGFENIAHRHQRRTKRPIAFDVFAILSTEEITGRRLSLDARRGRIRRPMSTRHPILLHHYFAIGAASQAIDTGFYIRDELIEVSSCLPKGERLLARVTRAREDVTHGVIPGEGGDSEYDRLIEPLDDDSFWDFISRTLKPTSLALTTMAYNEIFWRFSQELSETRLFQLAPIECRRPGVPIPSPELELHGGNLPAVVDYLQKNHRDAWSEVLESMRTVVPKLTDVRTEYTTDRRLAVQFVEEGFGRPWSSADISDGTIQSLALFCVLFDPRIRLTLIEEPENSVHPWIVRNFADACRKVTGKYVLVTTHSPVLVDHLRPEEVDIAWRGDGRSNVAPMVQLDPGSATLWSEGRNTISELLDSGSVDKAIPGEF